jgi:hypothetical protein
MRVNIKLGACSQCKKEVSENELYCNRRPDGGPICKACLMTNHMVNEKHTHMKEQVIDAVLYDALELCDDQPKDFTEALESLIAYVYDVTINAERESHAVKDVTAHMFLTLKTYVDWALKENETENQP